MANIFGFTDTWNNAGTAFDCIKCTVTNTASAAGSDLLDLSIVGGAQIRFIKTGVLSLSDGTHTGTITPSGTTGLTLSAPTTITGGTISGLTSLSVSGNVNLVGDRSVTFDSTHASVGEVGGVLNLSGVNGIAFASTVRLDNNTLNFTSGDSVRAIVNWINFNQADLTFQNEQVGGTYLDTLTLYRNANVGLGIAAPPNKLSVLGDIASYNAFTSASDYERVRLFWAAGISFIRLEQDGTGNPNGISIGSGGADPLYLETNSTARWQLTGSNGHMLAVTDNVTDIGASGASRPANLHLGSNLWLASSSSVIWSSRVQVASPANGVLTFADNTSVSFDRFQFGGTSNGYPALKRSTTELHVRLADDSADTVAQVSALKVAGTQVVGARVIDARADDVANSGDATTDGLIDALRDAMITHGLIAAA